MSRTKFNAMVSGLFQLGSSYEWIITKKAGRASEPDPLAVEDRESKAMNHPPFHWGVSESGISELNKLKEHQESGAKPPVKKMNKLYKKELALAFLLSYCCTQEPFISSRATFLLLAIPRQYSGDDGQYVFDKSLQTRINYTTRVAEEDSFRVVSSSKLGTEQMPETGAKFNEEDDEVDRRGKDRRPKETFANELLDDMANQSNKDADKEANKEDGDCPKVILLGYSSEQAGVGEDSECSLQEGNKEPEDCLENLTHSNEAQEFVGAGLEELQKEVERNLGSTLGPIVIGSNNNIRASQVEGINHQVELNPRKFRRALRSLTYDACMGSEKDEEIQNTLMSDAHNQEERLILNELHHTKLAGTKLGVAMK
ncbi:hypothetical protein Vadar_015082 [Vaccinium darrowii]|uniref:Uncharacterized protein n=1 Tax=Vaccinium darrowii TaxID=229202 RepID=A0ACB7XA37_9ERIC|nr:hypothetical protein Vadar_015082 [Vaccinium darrowii]